MEPMRYHRTRQPLSQVNRHLWIVVADHCRRLELPDRVQSRTRESTLADSRPTSYPPIYPAEHVGPIGSWVNELDR
jgi:hypothetical protein